MVSTAPIKLVLFGLGNMGRNHLRVLSILKDIDVLGIYDLDTSHAQALARQYGVRAFDTPEEVFEKEIPDAVIISTPTSTHLHYIKLTAKHVKNIFVEKPMSRSLAEAQEICELRNQHNLNIQVGFIERFNPVVQQLYNVLSASGRIINIDFVRTNKISARIKDVDVVSDLMIHDIDLALHLNGPAKSLMANGSTQDGYIDFASATIIHNNGRFSRILASRATEKKIRKIEATCEDLFVDCELFKKELIINRQSEIHQKYGEPFRISAIQENIEIKPQEALLLEIQAFINSCRGMKAFPVASDQDALEAIKICDQIQNRIYEQCAHP